MSIHCLLLLLQLLHTPQIARPLTSPGRPVRRPELHGTGRQLHREPAQAILQQPIAALLREPHYTCALFKTVLKTMAGAPRLQTQSYQAHLLPLMEQYVFPELSIFPPQSQVVYLPGGMLPAQEQQSLRQVPATLLLPLLRPPLITWIHTTAQRALKVRAWPL